MFYVAGRFLLLRAKETPEQSDRQHAKELGVSPTTVGTVRKELEAGVQIGHVSQMIGSDGKEYPRHVDSVRKKPVVSVFNPTKREVLEQAVISPTHGVVRLDVALSMNKSGAPEYAAVE